MSGNFADWMKYFSLSGLAAKIANIEKVIGTLPNTDNPVLVGTVSVLGGPVIIDSQAGNARSVVFTTAGTPRWLVGADNSAESGNNAGSNFVVQSYKDNGTPNQQTLTIARTNGTVTLTSRPSWGNGAGGTATPWDSSNLDMTQYETTAAAAQAAQVAAAATAAAIVTAGQNAAALYAPLANPALTGSVTIINNQSSNPSLTISAIGNAVGALFGMLGNGATAAAKYLQVKAGHFRILANDAATPLLDLDDSGNANFAGTVTALAFPNAALSGTPTAPTAAVGDNSTAVATTAFVTAAVAGSGPGPGGPYETVADAQVAYQNLQVYAQQQAAGAVTQAGVNADAKYATIAAVTLLQNTKANIASPTFSGTVTILGNTVFGGSAPAGFTISNSALTPRWKTQILGTESGNSAGSDLTISRVDDSANVTPALTVTRATGQATFATRPQWVVNGVNATPWDSSNFSTSTYLPVQNTPNGPTASLFKATGPQFFSVAPGNNNVFLNAIAAYFQSVGGTNTVYIAPNNAAASKQNETNGLIQGGDAAMVWDGGNGMVIGPLSGASLAPAGLRIDASGGINTATRPTFANNLAWDAGNFNPASYMPISGGTFTGQINGTNGVFSGLLLATGEIDVTGAAGTFRLNRWNTGSAWRFSMGLDQGAESGNNAGSNLNIWRYSDTQAVLDVPLSINRQSGLVTLAQRPMFGTATPWDSSNLNPASLPTNVQPIFTNGATTFGTAAAARFINGSTPTTNQIGVYPGLAASAYSNLVVTGDNAIISNPDLGTELAPLTIAVANSASAVGMRLIPTTSTTPVSQAAVVIAGVTQFINPVTVPALTAGPATFSARPTFAGYIPWDSQNLPGTFSSGTVSFNTSIAISGGFSVTASSVFGSATFNGTAAFGSAVNYGTTSAVTYSGSVKFLLGANVGFAGPTSFGVSPTAPTPTAGDNSTFVATTAFVQNAISTGVKFPYFITHNYQGPDGSSTNPPKPLGTQAVVLRHVFTQAVSLPPGFAGAQAITAVNGYSTGTSGLTIQSNRYTSMGFLTFTPLGRVGNWNVTEQIFQFQAGDVLEILTDSVNDPTLAGISITIPGTLT